jgi:hypothetical protein
VNDVGLIVAISGALIQTGILIATLKFLGVRQEQHERATQKDLNGMGLKERCIVAELIIACRDKEDFAVMVRKLIVGI